MRPLVRTALLTIFSLFFPCLILIPTLAFAQAPANSNQQVLDELRNIHTTLDKIEKNQRAMIALETIRLDESRVAVLEVQRTRLLNQVNSLRAETDRANATLQAVEHGRSAATGVQTSAADTADSPRMNAVQARADESSRRLDEAQRNLDLIGQQIADLNRRISEREKYLESF